MVSFEEANQKIWDMKADVFIPGAASKLITREQIDALIANGLQVVSCGANVPFIDDEVFFGPTAKYTDQKISVIPDFIANCGMARVFAYLMQPHALLTDERIFTDVSQTIRRALQEVMKINASPTQISTTALTAALGKLMDVPE
jgi:glutamate dehydrogenase/leucine dehydrogenase